MIERDIQTLVLLMILRFGGDASMVAAVRAGAFAAKGDTISAAIWSRIMEGVEAVELSSAARRVQ